MEVILKENIKGLGFKNDIVDVKPGYGRNYLIPQGYAVQATESNRKVLAENVKQAAHKVEKIKKDAETLAAAIGEVVLTIPAKVGESGKIFGAVTTLQISDALKALGHEVDRKKISFEGDVKEAGEYFAVLTLHKEVSHKVKFNVVAA
ncbi:large subunit ribosomal protein L9 [Flexibacter flexilis DSM 6793]|uniref:Large ribosomal subunit protein bL9 n=1 Tax=Flexibacter flexilis DSM 6793 TaxID=927664 RepID=A0A1I1MG13_9BACT|nr:50S ribosomal protein L9 [Flexibacter flexilis]SFC84339.1 large subunit ribosomal protein L9 [Flexibacter flexilis DSM 6793]